MANQTFVFDEASLQLHEPAGTINWTSDTIKVRLITSGTPNRTMTAMTTLTSGLADKTLTTTNRTKDTTNHYILYDATDPTAWTGTAAGSTVTHAVVFKFVTDDAGSTPIASLELTATPTGGDLTLAFSSSPACVFYTEQVTV